MLQRDPTQIDDNTRTRETTIVKKGISLVGTCMAADTFPFLAF